MPGIVCAIRGGPSSRITIDQAIRLAQKTRLPLNFLYVVNLDFLVRTESSRVRNITKEMEQMGDFILLAARSTAEEMGVAANGIVRHGDVGEEIIALAKELKADYVVLGRPRGEHEDDAFTIDRLEDFRQRIEEESGAEVILTQEAET